MTEWIEKPFMIRGVGKLTLRMSVRDIRTLEVESFERTLVIDPGADERAVAEVLRAAGSAWAQAREIRT